MEVSYQCCPKIITTTTTGLPCPRAMANYCSSSLPSSNRYSWDVRPRQDIDSAASYLRVLTWHRGTVTKRPATTHISVALFISPERQQNKTPHKTVTSLSLRPPPHTRTPLDLCLPYSYTTSQWTHSLPCFYLPFSSPPANSLSPLPTVRL